MIPAVRDGTHLARLLTLREVADMLRVSTSMVRALSRCGDLNVVHVGRLPRFAATDVAEYIARATGGRR